MKIVDFNFDTDDMIPGSGFFTWGEALYLPTWNRFATTADGLDPKIITSIEYFAANFLGPIRKFFECQFIVHCWYRPPPYSVLVGGSSTDVHTISHAVNSDYYASAVDFHPIITGDVIKDCRTFKAKIMPKLHTFNVRMEDNGPNGGWIHLDNLSPRPPMRNRFFKA